MPEEEALSLSAGGGLGGGATGAGLGDSAEKQSPKVESLALQGGIGLGGSFAAGQANSHKHGAVGTTAVTLPSSAPLSPSTAPINSAESKRPGQSQSPGNVAQHQGKESAEVAQGAESAESGCLDGLVAAALAQTAPGHATTVAALKAGVATAGITEEAAAALTAGGTKRVATAAATAWASLTRRLRL